MRGAYDNWASPYSVDDFFTGTRRNDDYYRGQQFQFPVDSMPKMGVILPEDRVPVRAVEPLPPQQDFLPVFPDFTILSCAELKNEVEELDNILLTSRFGNQDVRLAYENALARAQAELNKKCKSADVFIDDSKRDIKVEIPPSQSPKTFYDDKKEKPKEELQQPQKNNAQTYLYIGLGLVALLLIANLLKKEQNA